ncbi:MAG: cell division protein ZapA [Acidobacteria bacterium]|nr:cell division protein ZapA [Acidobacteriota bacterium]
MRICIMDRVYHLRSTAEEAYLQRLAAMVDEKMREVARTTPTVDTVKVAILAALNLANEYLQLRERYQALDKFVAERSDECAGLLEQALRK